MPCEVGYLNCPMCRNPNTYLYHNDSVREYRYCDVCDIVFVPTRYHLNPTDEKAEYDKHKNSPSDNGYRQFLSRLALPLLADIIPGSTGLDYGCGPGPTLSVMLQEKGHSVALYDKFYAADTDVLQKTYDFVTATEVIEHLSSPYTTLEEIWCLLKPGGVFAAMTKLVIDKESFAKWHYKNDPSHISFYSRRTLYWLAERWQAKLTFVADDAFLMHKAQ